MVGSEILPRRITALEVAKLVSGKVIGDENVEVSGISGIKEATEGDVTFLANEKYIHLLETTKASVIITSPDMKLPQINKTLILTENPSLAFARLVEHWFPQEVDHPKGIHPTAIIGENVQLGENVAIGAYVVIEKNVKIGGNTIIYAGSYIGHDTKIGDDCLIYPNVSIRERIIIGNRVIIHSGTVIGSDGFGFATVKGVHHRIPQIGTVVIEDDVEIGANVTIDRARFDKTVIGRGTKIDNLVQIAHNVIIGENAIIVAQSGISGSTVIGNGVILAGQTGVVGHISIGDGAVVGAQSGVTKSVPPGAVVLGSPARPISVTKRILACIPSLPDLKRTIEKLIRRVDALEKELAKRRSSDK